MSPLGSKNKSNSVRIIGGKYRARRIHFPDVPGLRPTPDRVRETVFNWLMHDLHEAKVLDLFTGSAALGIEALSRGARHVVFVEKDPKAASAIQQNLDNFKVLKSHYELYLGDALGYLNNKVSVQANNAGLSDESDQTGNKFDLIFLDPPFGKDLLRQCLPLCLKHLISGGKIYVEQESSLLPESYLPERLQILKEKTAGEVKYLLLECL